MALTAAKQPKGRPLTTWIKLINNKFQNPDLDKIESQTLQETASGKKGKRKLLLMLSSILLRPAVAAYFVSIIINKINIRNCTSHDIVQQFRLKKIQIYQQLQGQQNQI